jgi:tRNA (guanine-N7-)-methyltransferase
MKMYSEILKEDGIIHLKTDSNFLYTYTKAMVEENQLEVLFDTDDLYHSAIESEVLSIQTFYEKQWLGRGLNIKYLRFTCPKKDKWIEPDIEIEYDEYRSFGRNRI